MNSRLLVFGAGGQVGRALVEAASSNVVGLTHREVDICDTVAIAEALSKHEPTCLINAAAYTAVDRAESDVEKAFQVNRDGARSLAQAAQRADIPIIHLSTDYVFDGTSRVPYTETDPVTPINVYGQSKEEGERAVKEVCQKHLILHTSWLFSAFGTNFVRTMLHLAGQRSELGVVDDQMGCPTSAADVATAILAIVPMIKDQDFSDWGTYHYAGADALSWHGFATLIFAEAEKLGKRVPKLHPLTTREYLTAAARPAYSVLCTDKIQGTFGVKPRPLRQSLTEVLIKLNKEEGSFK